MAAELDGLVCSGAVRGRQHTYALLEERVPPAPLPTRDETIGRLARRFFASHGPATLRDFAGWSGLLARDARTGAESADPHLMRERIDGEEYWRSASTEQPPDLTDMPAHVLSNFDEYIVAYADRRAVLDRRPSRRSATWAPAASLLFANTVLVRGRVVATWRRTLEKDAVVVGVTMAGRMGRGDRMAVSDAAERYAAFLGKPLRLTYSVQRTDSAAGRGLVDD